MTNLPFVPLLDSYLKLLLTQTYLNWRKKKKKKKKQFNETKHRAQEQTQNQAESEGVEVGGNVNCYSHYGEQYGSSIFRIFLPLSGILQSLSWAYIWRKTGSKTIHAPQCSLQHCLQ